MLGCLRFQFVKLCFDIRLEFFKLSLAFGFTFSLHLCTRLVVEVFLDLQSCFDFGYDGCYIPTHDLGVVLGEVSIDDCFVVFLHQGNNGCFTVSQFLRNNVNQASFCRINGSTSNQTIEATNTITKQDADRTTQKPDNCTEQATF